MTGTDLQGRRILITGGSAGLGRAMAEAALQFLTGIGGDIANHR
jgi:NAD(P)-dependent dehydrogenase (short-subunit alcohol dehydrogenase family)